MKENPFTSKRIRGWDHIDMKQILEERFQMPVYMKNDVHLLALIEKEKYLSSETADFIYIGIRSGIGSAIFCKIALLTGITEMPATLATLRWT